MVHYEHKFALTKKQTERLVYVVDQFYQQALQTNCVPATFLVLLGGTVKIMKEQTKGLDQSDIDVVVWVLDTIFASFTEDDCDPLLEQAYHKLVGYWPLDPPWYERVKKQPPKPTQIQ
jgi:hypothetical protein